jgi:hypothetical protein
MIYVPIFVGFDTSSDAAKIIISSAFRAEEPIRFTVEGRNGETRFLDGTIIEVTGATSAGRNR